MSQLKVSVIIPVYNTEEYIGPTLESIINQALDDIEIIVINDGSTDNSLRVIEKYKALDNRITIVSQENKGLSLTRNAGINLAKGDYIYFMDSDDLLLENTLKECYEKCTSENLDFVFFDASTFGDLQHISIVNYRRTHLIEDKVYTGREILLRLFNVNGFLSSACLSFINLAYLKRIGLTFYPKILHEDELFTFQLYLNADRVSFLPEAYFKRRLRGDSIMTTKFSLRNVRSYLIIASQLIELKNKRSDEELNLLVDKRLSDMVYAVLYISRSLKLKDRLYLTSKSLTHLNKYVSVKDYILLVFPFLSKLKSNSNKNPIEN